MLTDTVRAADRRPTRSGRPWTGSFTAETLQIREMNAGRGVGPDRDTLSSAPRHFQHPRRQSPHRVTGDDTLSCGPCGWCDEHLGLVSWRPVRLPRRVRGARVPPRHAPGAAPAALGRGGPEGRAREVGVAGSPPPSPSRAPGSRPPGPPVRRPRRSARHRARCARAPGRSPGRSRRCSAGSPWCGSGSLTPSVPGHAASAAAPATSSPSTVATAPDWRWSPPPSSSPRRCGSRCPAASWTSPAPPSPAPSARSAG